MLYSINSKLRKVENVMKKYTQPTVEITAFDFEDITMSSLGAGSDPNTVNTYTATQTEKGNFVADGSTVEW